MWRRLPRGGIGGFVVPMGDFHGFKAYHDTYVVWADQEIRPIDLNSTEFDTDGYHFDSGSNLTGTVSKTNGSATITGSSTSFSSELSVGQVISIPGTSVEIGVVSAIASNTSLTLYQTMAHSASGQTAKRRNEYASCPAGFAGYYLLTGGTFINGGASQDTPMNFNVNGSAVIGSGITPDQDQPGDVGGVGHSTGLALLAEGDYFCLSLYIDNNGGGGTYNVGGASSFIPTWQRHLASWMSGIWLGT